MRDDQQFEARPEQARTVVSRGAFAPHRLFLWIAPLLYAAYALLIPPFQSFDENQHLYRAWQIASLQLTSERRGSQSGGELPPGLAPATLAEIGTLVPQVERRVVVRPISDVFNRNTPIGAQRPAIFYDFYGAAVYPPISYMPQTAAIWIGQATGLSVEWTLRLGRLLNSLLCIGLIFWALIVIPYGRNIMMIIGLLPPTAAAAAAFGQDGLIIGCSFLLIAAALHAARDRRWSARNLVIVALTGTVLTVCKIVYLPLIAIAAVPRPATVALRRWLSPPLIIGFVAALMLFAWMRITAHAIIPTFRPWVPTIPEQVSWALGHPIQFTALLGRTYAAWLPLAWAHLYEFGDSTVPIVWTGAVPGAAAVLTAMIRGDDQAPDLTRARRAWMLMIFAAVALLIATALFLTLAPRGAVTIEGIQARYFLPALPLAAIAVMHRRETPPPRLMTAALALVLVAHAATLGAISATFYSF